MEHAGIVVLAADSNIRLEMAHAGVVSLAVASSGRSTLALVDDDFVSAVILFVHSELGFVHIGTIDGQGTAVVHSYDFRA